MATCFFQSSDPPRDLHSFPTRRSSDLRSPRRRGGSGRSPPTPAEAGVGGERPDPDRKSTRLNSSHVRTSYAVFCLKKKNKTPIAILQINALRDISEHHVPQLAPIGERL